MRPAEIIDESGRVTAEKKVTTCPEMIGSWLDEHAPGLVRVGMETGTLAVWLWNELHERGGGVEGSPHPNAGCAASMRLTAERTLSPA